MKKVLFVGVFAFFVLFNVNFDIFSSINNVSINPQPEPPGFEVIDF